MAKHNADETQVLNSKAVIYKNEYGVWQFRFWLRNENKYLRRSLRTKVKSYAMEEAEQLYFEVRTRQNEGRKYFAMSVKDAVIDFLMYQQTRIGDGRYNIVEGRYKTIDRHMRTFLEYVRKDDKITDLRDTTLIRYERYNGITSYPAFRQAKQISDSTIWNEMTTINSFMKYCYSVAKLTHISTFKYPETNKRNTGTDGEVIRRQTFTVDEWQKFYRAMDDIYTSKKHNKGVTEEEMFERQMVRHYFLVAANSGLRSSELRKLDFSNVSTYKDKTNRGEEAIFANIWVDRSTSKVRKGRRVYCRGGHYIDRWKRICKQYGRPLEGMVFSIDGTEYSPSNTQKHKQIIKTYTDIDQERQKQLVPYSLRHFMVTERVKAGLNFSQVAQMTGTSVRQIEQTYLHLNDEMMKTSAKADYIKDQSTGALIPV